MADRRIYAGYYRRYDGKMIYVVTMAKDECSSFQQRQYHNTYNKAIW